MVRERRPSVSVCLRGSPLPGSDPRRTVVWIRGEHDIATCEHLRLAIDSAAGLDDADVVVDLSRVTFMDASTLGALVGAHRTLDARSRSLLVRAPTRAARRLLEVCELGFLIDERPMPAPSAPALDSWVAVPVSERASEPAPRPVEQSGAGERRRAPL